MAFTKDLTTTDGYAVPVDGVVGKEFQMNRRVDFSVAANQLAQNEIVALFKVPAGVLVEEVIPYVETPDTDVTDVDIGGFTTAGVAIVADGFIDGGTLAAAGAVRDFAGETYSRQDGTAGFCSTSNWIIGLTNKDADTLNGAVVNFVAICKDLRA